MQEIHAIGPFGILRRLDVNGLVSIVRILATGGSMQDMAHSGAYPRPH